MREQDPMLVLPERGGARGGVPGLAGDRAGQLGPARVSAGLVRAQGDAYGQQSVQVREVRRSVQGRGKVLSVEDSASYSYSIAASLHLRPAHVSED